MTHVTGIGDLPWWRRSPIFPYYSSSSPSNSILVHLQLKFSSTLGDSHDIVANMRARVTRSCLIKGIAAVWRCKGCETMEWNQKIPSRHSGLHPGAHRKVHLSPYFLHPLPSPPFICGSFRVERPTVRMARVDSVCLGRWLALRRSHRGKCPIPTTFAYRSEEASLNTLYNVMTNIREIAKHEKG